MGEETLKPEQVFQRYDIRGRYPEEVDQEFAERLGKALGTFSTRNYLQQVVVGKDTKSSSKILKQAFINGLNKAGVDVIDAGTGPTDYVAFTGQQNSSVSVQVTSSHLPLDTNGFKFMYPEGNGFLNDDLFKVQKTFQDKDFVTGNGKVIKAENAAKAYRKQLVEFFHNYFDTINRKVVVDTLGGAATEVMPEMLESLGAEVVNIASEQEGETPYMDPPSPEPHRMDALEERVEEEDAELGIATDMDGDRVAVFYRDRWLTGDELFAVLVQQLDAGNIVASIDTSRMVEEMVERKDGAIDYTRVGDPFVINQALESDADLAGEPNGHYCLPRFTPYNSGTLSALLLAAMSLESALEEIPVYYTERSKIEVEDTEEKMAAVVEEVIDNYEVISDLDGIKFKYGAATVLIRPSGSSSLLRVKTDSSSSKEAITALEKVEEMVRNA